MSKGLIDDGITLQKAMWRSTEILVYSLYKLLRESAVLQIDPLWSLLFLHIIITCLVQLLKNVSSGNRENSVGNVVMFASLLKFRILLSIYLSILQQKWMDKIWTRVLVKKYSSSFEISVIESNSLQKYW